MTQKTNPVTPLASPLGEEGHEVAKGVQANWIHRGASRPANPVRRHPAKSVCEGKNDYDTLILYLIALRSVGRRLAVRTAMEHPIGALPRTPFPASRDFPSRGNERYEGKNSKSYTSGTILAFSPFGGWRHHLARWEACHWIRGSPTTPL